MQWRRPSPNTSGSSPPARCPVFPIWKHSETYARSAVKLLLFSRKVARSVTAAVIANVDIQYWGKQLMIYWEQLKSLLLHKWYVLLAGRIIGVSLWRLIIHDWSKFSPTEFFRYARYKYRDGGREEWAIGWLHGTPFKEAPGFSLGRN